MSSPPPGPTQLAPREPAQAGTDGADRDGRPDPGRGGEDASTVAGLGSWPIGTGVPGVRQERGEAFTAGVKIATLDPFQGYKNAIDDELQDAVAVVDAFHIVKLDGPALDEVRRRVQQETLGHGGRKGDPLCGIRLALRCGIERLTELQRDRVTAAIDANEAHLGVLLAWLATQEGPKTALGGPWWSTWGEADETLIQQWLPAGMLTPTAR